MSVENHQSPGERSGASCAREPAGDEGESGQHGGGGGANAKPEGFGSTVGRGMSWMLVSALGSKVVAVLAQGVLGYLLLPEHFGRFAVATAVAGLLMLCKDGGVPNFLVKRGAGEYVSLSGPSFWLSLVYNTAAAGLMAALAWPIGALLYGDSALAPMLWIMALSLPLGTPGAVLMAKLRLELRFREISLIMGFSIVLRQALTVLLALLGFQELSFAIPVACVAVFESVAAGVMCRDTPWRRGVRLDRWGEIVAQTKWLVLGSVGSFLNDWGPYTVLGYMLTKETVGYYFFSYMIISQVGMLLSHNLQVVLMPVMARMSHDAERFAGAMARSCRALMMASTFLCMGVAAVMPALEHLIWRGRWSESVIAVVLMGVFYPWRIASSISAASFQAQGRFKLLSGLNWIEGLALVSMTVIGAAIEPSVRCVALAVGVTLMFNRIMSMAVLFHTSGVPIRRVFTSMSPGWLVAVAAGGFGIVADLYTPLDQWIPQMLPGSWGEGLVTTVVDLARCTLSGGVYCLAFGLLARLMLAGDIREALSMMPGRVRGPVTRLLRL
ncbi:MAG: oligosaccharide flippase family protein [Phycisphaeraceae bacterium]|nr:oligosaccharide flippase family protein [Phycisphaeraceae bacterium]